MNNQSQRETILTPSKVDPCLFSTKFLLLLFPKEVSRSQCCESPVWWALLFRIPALSVWCFLDIKSIICWISCWISMKKIALLGIMTIIWLCVGVLEYLNLGAKISLYELLLFSYSFGSQVSSSFLQKPAGTDTRALRKKQGSIPHALLLSNSLIGSYNVFPG